MTILTEAVMEKAARAMELELVGLEMSRSALMDLSRAALEAVLPDIIEECIRAAKKPRPLDAGQDMLANEIITALRSLAQKE